MTNEIRTSARPQPGLSVLATWLLFAAIFAAVYFASLFTPPLMDDVDSAHAQAAQHIAESGDWVTAKINGIRYIEKPPLPYWTGGRQLPHLWREHLCHPSAQCAGHAGPGLASWLWARRAWGPRAGLYAGLGVLTSIGPFLFTRFIIPEAILSLFLLLALYCLITGLEPSAPARFYWMWAAWRWRC